MSFKSEAIAGAERGCGTPLAYNTTACGHIDALTGKIQYCFVCNQRLYYARQLPDTPPGPPDPPRPAGWRNDVG